MSRISKECEMGCTAGWFVLSPDDIGGFLSSTTVSCTYFFGIMDERVFPKKTIKTTSKEGEVTELSKRTTIDIKIDELFINGAELIDFEEKNPELVSGNPTAKKGQREAIGQTLICL